MTSRLNEQQIALAYLNAFCSSDIDGLALLLHTSLSYKGPLYQFESAADYLQCLRRDPPVPGHYKIKRMSKKGRVIHLSYEYIKQTKNISITQDFKIENGKITETQLDFDSTQHEINA